MIFNKLSYSSFLSTFPLKRDTEIYHSNSIITFYYYNFISTYILSPAILNYIPSPVGQFY
jgi:hypothetical protein